MINPNILKEEGRAGLLYAYDPSHQLVSAVDSINGIQYTCPVCGCPMHPTTTRTGKRIFVRKTGSVHTNRICDTLEKNKNKRSFGNQSPQVFIHGLCFVTPRTGDPGQRGGGGTSNPGPTGIDISFSSFNSLKQIDEAGVMFFNPEDRLGIYLISDYIITYKYGDQFFLNPHFQLGARIVYARYLWSDSSSSSITFGQYKEGSYSVRFRVLFKKKSDFKKYREKFGEFVEDENGRTVFRKRHKRQDVLLASDDWVLIQKPQCHTICSPDPKFCAICCGTYQTFFTNDKQIYLCPVDG